MQLDASASVDEDDLDLSFEFSWYCENGSGGTCLSRTGETLLEMSPSVNEAVLSVPAGSLPVGKPVENPITLGSTSSSGGPLHS